MYRILPLCLVVVLAACDSDGVSGSMQPGTFEATITGAVQTNLQGVAMFGSAAFAEEGFAISLTSTMGAEAIGLHRPAAGRPGPGSYPLRDLGGGPDNHEFWASVYIADPERFFVSQSGTLEISSSSSSQLVGSVEFQAVEVAGTMVTVTATFSAMCAEVAGASCD